MASRTKAQRATRARAEAVAKLAVRELGDDPEALAIVVALVKALARGSRRVVRRSRN